MRRITLSVAICLTLVLASCGPDVEPVLPGPGDAEVPAKTTDPAPVEQPTTDPTPDPAPETPPEPTPEPEPESHVIGDIVDALRRNELSAVDAKFATLEDYRAAQMRERSDDEQWSAQDEKMLAAAHANYVEEFKGRLERLRRSITDEAWSTARIESVSTPEAPEDGRGGALVETATVRMEAGGSTATIQISVDLLRGTSEWRAIRDPVLAKFEAAVLTEAGLAHACTDRLAELGKVFFVARIERPGRPPYDGAAYFIHLLKSYAVERTELLTCPSDPVTARSTGPKPLEDLDPKSVKPDDCSFAVRDFSRFPLRLDARTRQIIACDRQGSDGRTAHHPDGINVLYDDGRVKFLTRGDLGLAPGEDIVVGPESSHPELRTLRYDTAR